MTDLPDIQLTITIRRPSAAEPDGYMAMSMQQLQPEPGESHLRGEDASDGPCNTTTLGNIMADLGSYFADGTKSPDPVSWVRRAAKGFFNRGPRLI